MADENPRAGEGRRRPAKNVPGLDRSALCARLGAHIAYLKSQVPTHKRDSADVEREVIEQVVKHLEAAEREVEPRRWYRKIFRRLFNTDIVTALSNIAEAEVELTRVSSGDDLRSRFPQVLTQAREHLPADHPQRTLLEREWSRFERWRRLFPWKAGSVVAETLHAANKVEETERARVRSFTQILIWSITIMTVIAILFGLWASADSDVADLFCFPGQEVPPARVCPLGGNRADGSDVFLIEFMGMFAAALAGAVSLKTMRGNSSPYQVSVLLLLLRLPVGAMTAVLGILLVSGAFLPGLTSLDASPQVVAWAAAFGILQEPVTRTVDRTGRAFLDDLTPAEGKKSAPPAGRSQQRGPAGPPPRRRE